MTLHESQSLLLEMQAARSEEFIRYLAPITQQILGGSGPAWEADNIMRLSRKVEPGLISVYADEVTYPLHVILRYKLEKAIIADDIKVDDLPTAWNEMMDKYLGVTPPNDTDGVLQDVHWPEGLLGYFPTYSLGAMTAAQIFAAATDAELLVSGTRRRLCLPAERDGEIADWLATNPPPFPEQVVTVRWPGAAEPA